MKVWKVVDGNLNKYDKVLSHRNQFNIINIFWNVQITIGQKQAKESGPQLSQLKHWGIDSLDIFCQDVDDDLIINTPFIVTPTILHHSQAKTINFDHEWSWWLVKSISNTMMDSMLQSSPEMDRFKDVITQWSADQVEN